MPRGVSVSLREGECFQAARSEHESTAFEYHYQDFRFQRTGMLRVHLRRNINTWCEGVFTNTLYVLPQITVLM